MRLSGLSGRPRAQDAPKLVLREPVLRGLDGREKEDLLLEVRREQRVVDDLRDAGAREAELAGQVGEVAGEALIDHPLEPAGLDEEARDARDASRDVGFGGRRAVADHDAVRRPREVQLEVQRDRAVVHAVGPFRSPPRASAASSATPVGDRVRSRSPVRPS